MCLGRSFLHEFSKYFFNKFQQIFSDYSKARDISKLLYVDNSYIIWGFEVEFYRKEKGKGFVFIFLKDFWWTLRRKLTESMNFVKRLRGKIWTF